MGIRYCVADEGAVADDIRGVALGITVLAGVGVEHELRQGAVQAGGLAFHQAEARTGQGGGGFKIKPELFAQVHMVFDFEIKLARRTHTAHFHVFGFIFAHRHALVRQIRNAEQQGIDLRLYGLIIGIGLFQIRFDLCYFGHGCFGFSMFALPFEHTDLFGHAVAP